MFGIGQKVKAKITMTNDLRDAGMGVEVCAYAGDELIIREDRGNGRFAVSHEDITDNSFIATDGELEEI